MTRDALEVIQSKKKKKKKVTTIQEFSPPPLIKKRWKKQARSHSAICHSHTLLLIIVHNGLGFSLLLVGWLFFYLRFMQCLGSDRLCETEEQRSYCSL